MVLHLQNLKAPWVDECYSYYGVWHDSFSEFYNSMLSGINFSPPLYFLLNFCIQLVFPTSIEALRIQSLIWTLVGLVLCFMACRRLWGNIPAFIGFFLVASSSDLLLSNASEARHYSMFFACGAWVLYELTRKENNKKLLPFTFFAHLSLCLVHYFGIIFSSIVGLVLLIKNRRIPKTLVCCWLLAIPLYLYFLTNQSSHLGEWPRPNSVNDLFDAYKGAIVFLFLLIPVLAGLLSASDKNFSKQTLGHLSHPVIIIAFFWYLSPFLAWCISHISEVNLFKERYFIPKEAGLVVLVTFACHKIFESLAFFSCKSFAGKFFPLFSTSMLCIFLLFLHLKRSVFALDPKRNYYSWLLYDDQFSSEDIPVVFCGDPVFFPNAYNTKGQYFFRIDDENLENIYSQFSSKIQLVNPSQFLTWDSFILIGEKNSFENLNLSSFLATEIGKVHERLPLLIKKFERI